MTYAQQPTIGTINEPVERTQWNTVVTLALATLIIASEMTLTAFALPLISAEFGMVSSATAWVLLAYTLPLIALAIPAGQWVDSADVRLVFLLSLTGIGVTSLLAAIAPSFEILMVGRVLQGLAAAVYLAVYMPVVSATVLPHQRGRAISIIATIMMLGSVALAPVGGFVAEAFGWRAVFLIKLPLLAFVLWLGYHALPVERDKSGIRQKLPTPKPTMLRETLLIGGAMTALLMAVEFIERPGFIALGLAGLSVGLLVLWTRLASSQPVVALFRRRRLGLPALSLMLISSIMGLIAFTLPFFVAEVMGRSPQALSAAMLGFVGAAAVVSPIAGALADRYGALNVATTGGALTVLGMLTLATLDADATIVDLVWRAAAAGAGMAVFNAPNMTAILEATPNDQTGAASGIASVARMLGSTLGPAIAALAWSLNAGGVEGLRAGVWALSALALIGFLALLAARR